MEIKNKVSYININDIVLMDNNPRKISRENFERLKKSIKENKDYFEARPIICNNRTGQNVIIAGNQRYRAAKELKMKMIPCVIMTLTEEKEKEINIRDNVELGEWDYDILKTDWNVDNLEDWGVDTTGLMEDIEEQDEETDNILTDISLKKININFYYKDSKDIIEKFLKEIMEKYPILIEQIEITE